MYVDVGKQGRLSDVGVISSTKFYDLLVKNELQFSNNDENDEKLNFVIVGDEVFALHEHILKRFLREIWRMKDVFIITGFPDVEM